MSDVPTFESREAAEEYRRERERGGSAAWIVWQAEDGRWRAGETSLPRADDPDGTLIESKPRPPDADDPRAPQQRDAPWGAV